VEGCRGDDGPEDAIGPQRHAEGEGGAADGGEEEPDGGSGDLSGGDAAETDARVENGSAEDEEDEDMDDRGVGLLLHDARLRDRRGDHEFERPSLAFFGRQRRHEHRHDEGDQDGAGPEEGLEDGAAAALHVGAVAGPGPHRGSRSGESGEEEVADDPPDFGGAGGDGQAPDGRGPWDGTRTVARMRIMVALPAPFGPMKPPISPRPTVKVTWSRAHRAPNPRETPLSSITAGLPGGSGPECRR
jgi:hypothetical protein